MKKGTTVITIKPSKGRYKITKVKGNKKLFKKGMTTFYQEMHLPNQQQTPFI